MDENIIPAAQENPQPSKINSYKAVCAKLGLMMCVYFLCRMMTVYVARFVFGFTDTEAMSDGMFTVISGSISIIMVYIIPLLFTVFLFGGFRYFKSEAFKKSMKNPKNSARAYGAFPAMYGLGYGVVLLTLLGGRIIARLSTSGEAARVEQLFEPTSMPPTTNIAGLIMVVFMLAVAAPIVEEVWMRGIVFDALGPFGYGITIVITSLLFGLMHGSMYMLFYTTAFGFALGYVRYATGSLLVVIVLHAIINGVQALLITLNSLADMHDNRNALFNTAANIYLIAMLVLVVVGIIAFIAKIPVIRKYKIENNWTEIRGKKKLGMFLISVPVMLMIILAADVHTGGMLFDMITR